MPEDTIYAQPQTLRAAGLAEMAQLLKSQRARALDVVAPATALRSQGGLFVVQGTEPVITDDGVDSTDGAYRLTRTAERGLASKLDIPPAYLRRMHETRPDMFDANVNGWLHGDEPTHAPADHRKFLVRILRGDDTDAGYVRAFLSDTYKVIDSLDVLMATLDGIRQAGVEAEIRECDLTESKMYVKVWSPEVQALAPDLLAGYSSPFDRGAVRWGNAGGWTIERAREAAKREGLGYEPGQEPVVFGGFVIRNSETGEGRFEIAPQIVISICGNGLTFTGDAIAKTHLGGKLDAGIIRWGEDTEATNLKLIVQQSRDAVRAFLSQDYVEAKVAELTEAAGVPVDAPAEAVKVVAKKLQFSDAQSAAILEHFIAAGQRTAGGIMQAVSSVAQTLSDADVAADLEAKAVPAMALVGAGR